MLIYKWLLNSVAAFAPPDKPGAAPAVSDPPAGDGAPGADDGQGEAGGAGGADGGAGDDDATGDGAGGDDDAAGGGDGDGQPPTPPARAAEDWRDKEIKRKHGQLQSEKREKARLQQELDDAKALLARQPKKEGEPAAPAAPARTFTKDDVDRAAAVQVAQGEYDRQCNDTFNKGKATYKDDWDKALEQLNVLGGLGDDQQGVEVMQGILAADDPAKVLYELGSKPDEYHRVMALPPARRLAEIVKLGIPDKPKPGKKPSALDPPPNGITRRAQVDDSGVKLYDDKTEDNDWYAIRTAQKARNFAKTGNPFKSA